MKPDTDTNKQISAQDTTPSPPNNTNPTTKPASPPSDTPLLPHAPSTLSTAATSATETLSSAAASATDTISSIATTAASTVKTAASDALAWTEEKIEKLGAKPEEGRGPYGSAATAPGALSEFDVIAQGVGVSLVGGEDVKGGEKEDKKGE